MKRKITVLTLCAILFALCGSVDAQQTKKIPTVGFLLEGFPSSISDSIRIDAFEKACTKSAILKEKVSSSSTGLQRAKRAPFGSGIRVGPTQAGCDRYLWNRRCCCAQAGHHDDTHRDG